jgi:hypothetical protein
MNFGYRHCSAGPALRDQISRFHPKAYVPTVMIKNVRMPLNRKFQRAVQADDYAKRFAVKWNAAEDSRLAKVISQASKLNSLPPDAPVDLITEMLT